MRFTKIVSRAGILFALTLGASGLAPAASSLGAYNVNPNTVTVAGISSGGYMAVQLQVAYSSHFFGTAVIAGGTYYCAQDNAVLWAASCATGVGIPVSALVNFTNSQAAAGTIDPTSNIGGKPIYMFSGLLDTVDYQETMDDLRLYYESFTNSGKITYNNSTPAEHSWVTPDAIDPCYLLSPPFLNNCGIDVEKTFLTQFYGTLKSRTSHPQGTYVQFDQNAFCAGSNCAPIGMDSTAWLYVPNSCAANAACKLVVALHGCLSNQQTIGTQFVKGSGINEWADNNNILVLYPQTIASVIPVNSEGCWDWWGYTNSNYAVKSSPQMTSIMNMVNQITSGF
jgi:poly(3-hydroxybutyrate) depolymerase